MDLGFSAKTYAWIKVVGVVLAAVQVAYTGFASDQWISAAEWGSLFQVAGVSFIGAVTGSPKDARDPAPIPPDRQAAIAAGAQARGGD